MQPPNPESTWSVFFKYPLQTLALILGGSAVAAAAGVSRHGDYAVALACGALGFAILLGAGLMMVRSDAWEGTVDEWGSVATDPRQRLNFLLVGVGTLAIGAGAMWLGFGPGMLVGQLLLVAGGWMMFLIGVVCLVGWVQAQRLFG